MVKTLSQWFAFIMLCLSLVGCAVINDRWASITDPCTYYVGRENDKAIEECTKALGSKYEPYIYNNRGAAYLNKGLLDLGMADLNMAIKLDSELAVAYFNRGNTNFKLRHYDFAIADFDKARQLDSRYLDESKYNTLNNAVIRAVLRELTQAKTQLRLGIVVSSINNVYYVPNMKEWKEGIRLLLISTNEQYYLDALKGDPNFQLISRNKIQEVLGEQTFENLGFTKNQAEFGQMINATHLLVIDFSRYSSKSNVDQHEDVMTYTLLEVNTGRIIASQVVRSDGS